jgi:hypothetical protein
MNPEIMLLGLRAALLMTAFLGFAWALLRMRRESAAQLEQLHIAQQQARAETHALAEKISALATLVAALPQRTEPKVEAEPPPAPRRDSSGGRSYETAKRLARSGATVEEIVATCGVAGTEARLLRRLHGADRLRAHDAA